MTRQDKLVPAEALAARNTAHFPNESAEYRMARNALLAREIEIAPPHRAGGGAPPPAPARRRGPRGLPLHRRERRDHPLRLFGDKDTLVIYSYMFGPERKAPCPMCTSFIGSFASKVADVRQQVALAFVARSPIERLIEAKRAPRLDRHPGLFRQRRRLHPRLRQRRGRGRPRPHRLHPHATAPSATSGAARSAATWPTPARTRAASPRWTRSGSSSTPPRPAAAPTGTRSSPTAPQPALPRCSGRPTPASRAPRPRSLTPADLQTHSRSRRLMKQPLASAPRCRTAPSLPCPAKARATVAARRERADALQRRWRAVPEQRA